MRYTADRLLSFVSRALSRLDIPEADAALVAGSLVDADAAGQSGHGLIRLPFLLSRLKSGHIATHPDVRLIHETPSVALLDGGNGLGPVVGSRAIKIAVDKARATGAALCAVRRSNHLGAMGFYVERAAREGMITIGLSNTPPAMAPPGAHDPFLGTNPIAAAFPTKSTPVVVDLATSQVARGRILKAARNGEPIPHGWAVDAGGRTTTDPVTALQGSLVPLGGAKGFALALIVEALTGVLAGAAVGRAVGGTYMNTDQESNVGHTFIAIDPSAASDGFPDRMHALAEAVRKLEPVDPTRPVRMPGDRRQTDSQRNRAEGIELSNDLVAELEEAAGINI